LAPGWPTHTTTKNLTGLNPPSEPLGQSSSLCDSVCESASAPGISHFLGPNSLFFYSLLLLGHKERLSLKALSARVRNASRQATTKRKRTVVYGGLTLACELARLRFLFSFSILSLAEPARAVLWLSNKEREKEKASS